MVTVLGALGMTLIITKSYLFSFIRESDYVCKKEWLYTLLHCPQCSGWWCGFILAIVSSFLMTDGTFIHIVLESVLYGFTTSLFAEMIQKIFYDGKE